MAFTQKYLAASFTLSQGQFGSGGNSKTVSGLRMSARITTAGGDDSGTMMLTIFGMSLSDMSALSILPFQLTAIG